MELKSRNSDIMSQVLDFGIHREPERRATTTRGLHTGSTVFAGFVIGFHPAAAPQRERENGMGGRKCEHGMRSEDLFSLVDQQLYFSPQREDTSRITVFPHSTVISSS